MNTAKSILYGATALAVIAGNTYGFMEEPSSGSASTMYEVDEDRDGRTDRLLMLEQSDSLA